MHVSATDKMLKRTEVRMNLQWAPNPKSLSICKRRCEWNCNELQTLKTSSICKRRCEWNCNELQTLKTSLICCKRTRQVASGYGWAQWGFALWQESSIPGCGVCWSKKTPTGATAAKIDRYPIPSSMLLCAFSSSLSAVVAGGCNCWIKGGKKGLIFWLNNEKGHYRMAMAMAVSWSAGTTPLLVACFPSAGNNYKLFECRGNLWSSRRVRPGAGTLTASCCCWWWSSSSSSSSLHGRLSDEAAQDRSLVIGRQDGAYFERKEEWKNSGIWRRSMGGRREALLFLVSSFSAVSAGGVREANAAEGKRFRLYCRNFVSVNCVWSREQQDFAVTCAVCTANSSICLHCDKLSCIKTVCSLQGGCNPKGSVLQKPSSRTVLQSH